MSRLARVAGAAVALLLGVGTPSRAGGLRDCAGVAAVGDPGGLILTDGAIADETGPLRSWDRGARGEHGAKRGGTIRDLVSTAGSVPARLLAAELVALRITAGPSGSLGVRFIDTDWGCFLRPEEASASKADAVEQRDEPIGDAEWRVKRAAATVLSHEEPRRLGLIEFGLDRRGRTTSDPGDGSDSPGPGGGSLAIVGLLAGLGGRSRTRVGCR